MGKYNPHIGHLKNKTQLLSFFNTFGRNAGLAFSVPADVDLNMVRTGDVLA